MKSACIIACIFLFIVGISSCSKETIIEKQTVIERDTVIIKRDTIIIKRDTIIIKPEDLYTRNKLLHYGVWTFYQHEIESYAGNVLIGKKVEKFVNRTVEWKVNGTYIQNIYGSLQTGTWDLVSPSLFRYDKDDLVNERYYHIIQIDSFNYYRKGPFNKNGGLHRDFLTVEYYKK